MQDLTAETADSAEKTDFQAMDAPISPEGGDAADAEATGRNVDAIFSVKLDVRVVLGRTRLPISEVLALSKGSVLELDRKVGDPVDIMVNDRMVARGDLVKVGDDMIGVALREIVKDFVS